jgi:hypothetical protein
MSLKKLGTLLVAMLALGAIVASSASATATTVAKEWNTTGTIKEAITIGKHKVASGEELAVGEFTTTVSGLGLDLTSTGAKCLSCSISNSGGAAIGSGKIKFTGVTAMAPAKCKVRNESVETTALKIEAHYMEGETVYVKFSPASGEAFATVQLENKSTGETCPISTGVVVKGSLYAQAENKTGVAATLQNVTLDPAINATAGGELKVGTEKASLYGKAGFELTSGAAFKVG